MLTPFEFGQAVGQYEKSAGIGDFARGAWDIGKYMIPGVGTAYGVADAWNSARQGNVMGTLGNLALAGTSLIPGAGGLIGGAVKGVGKNLLRAGVRAGTQTALGNTARTAGRAVLKTTGALDAAGRTMRGVNNAVASGVQRVVPVNNATPYMTRKVINSAVKNPLTAFGYGTMLSGAGAPNPGLAAAATLGAEGGPQAAPQMAPRPTMAPPRPRPQAYGQVPKVNW